MKVTDPKEKPLHLDFIYVVHSPETFADKEYKKWLAERDAKKTEEKDRVKHL